jgi:hypothetical protein
MVALAGNGSGIADGGTTKKLTSKYKQNDNKKRNSKG